MVSASLAFRDLKKKDPAKAASWVAVLKQHPNFAGLWKPVLDELEPARHDEALFMLAARWPDDARDEPLSDTFHRRVWHFADRPILQAGAPSGIADVVLPNPLGPNDKDEGFNNLLVALPHNLALIAGASGADPDAKAVALCWVLHLMGDLHQPLHMVSRFSADFPEGDKGGNDTFIAIPPSTKALNYHSFWDGLVLRSGDDRLVSSRPALLARGITRASQRAAVLAARADLERADFPQLSATQIKDWAEEGLQIARKVGYLDGTLTEGADERRPFEMPDGFSALAQGIAESQVALAGFRMSDELAK